MSDYPSIAGAFELAFGAVEAAAANESSPSTATLTLVAVSPTVSGGVVTVIPETAVLTLTALSPDVTGGAESVVPAVAILTLVAVSPAVLPSVQTRAAVLGVFGFELAQIADEFEMEPAYLGTFGTQ